MKPTFTLLLAVLIAGQCALAVSLRSAEWKLTVKAGDHARSGSVVSFVPPADAGSKLSLKDGSGNTLPAQWVGAKAVFIEPSLKQGEEKDYTLVAEAGGADSLTVKKDGDVLKLLTTDGKSILDYQMAPGPVPPDVPEQFRHGAHLHPVFSPSGRVLTGNHPPDHRWHRGVWMSWTHTEFQGREPDFWNMAKDKSGKLTGEIRFASLEQTWSGPVQAGFVSHHRHIDHTSGAEIDALAETWELAATPVSAGGKAAYLIDLTSIQTCAGDSPMKLPTYHYGGLGVRGNPLWNPKEAVTMLTSNGDDRKAGDAKKAKWVHIGGMVEDKPTGMAILIHPENFRFPQPLRLNPSNPQLCVAPSQDGDWDIVPGKPLVSRYRIVAIDGEVDAGLLEQMWQDYANPVKASVE